MPRSNAELREKCGPADDDPVVAVAVGDDEPADVVAPVAELVAPAVVVAGTELADLLADEVPDDEGEDEVVELEDPFALA